jgi:tetratricopeptide (TPR) repeat protein
VKRHQSRRHADRDLETIILKALEKDPARRYQNALALAEDIERYLSDQPISARPANAAYQLRKLVARHKASFTFMVSLLLMVIAIRRKLLGEEHLDVSQSLTDLAMVLRRKETEEAVNEAERNMREALRIRLKLHAGDHPEVAASLNNLGLVLYLNRRNYAGDEHQEMAINTNNLASLLRDTGRYDEAVVLFHRVLELNRKILGENHPVTAIALINLAITLQRKKDFVNAESAYRQAMDLKRKTFPETHWEIATVKNMLGSCLTDARRYGEAEPLLMESYPVIRASFGDSHNRTIVALRRILDLYKAWNKPEKAAFYSGMMPVPGKIPKED